MEIKEDIIRNQNKQRIAIAEDYALPYTLGNPPKDVQKALDRCFAPVSNMLTHALEDLSVEGLPVFPGYGILTGLAQNGLIRAGVETRADEMTRKWGEIVPAGGDDTDEKQEVIEALTKEMERFKVQKLLNEAASMCGYYGGCLYYIDTGAEDKEMVNPLVLEPVTFRQGSLKGFRLIEPFMVSPGRYNSVNPMASDYFKPDVWYVQGIPVHSSRLLYFAENNLPSLLKPAYNFFGLSLAQKVLDAVSHYTACREAAARLLQKYALTVFKTDMSQILSGGMDDTINRRIAYFVQNRDNDGCATIDKESEDLVVMTTSLAGVTDLVRQAQEYVAAMFNEPVTKMWGLSPAGFSTGDSDLRNHYDNIESLQEKIFTAPMARLLNVLQMNKLGVIDHSLRFDFAPLSEEDKGAEIANNKAKAETLISLTDANIISPEEARQTLIDDPDSGFGNLPPYEPSSEMEPLTPFDPNENPDGEKEEKEVDVI